MAGERRSDLDAEIPDRHVLQLDLLSHGLAAAAVLRKSSRGLALEFAFAEFADVGADHEAIDVLGVDALLARRPAASWQGTALPLAVIL